jgi:hypothetical protein
VDGIVIIGICSGLFILIYYSYSKGNFDIPTNSAIHSTLTKEGTGALKPETLAYLRKQKYTTYFCVAGIQYYDYHIAAKRRLFRDAIPITLKRQPKNRKDPNAIEVFFADVKVGYVSWYEASQLAPCFDRGDKFTGYLESYNSRKYYDDRIEIELVNETLKLEIEGPNDEKT